jgi:hypothetical protein
MRRAVPRGRSGIVLGGVAASWRSIRITVPGLRRTASRCIAPGMTRKGREPSSSRTPCGAKCRVADPGSLRGWRSHVVALDPDDGPGSAPHRFALRRARDDEERACNAVIPDAMRRNVPRGRPGIVLGGVAASWRSIRITVPGLRRTAPRCAALGMTKGANPGHFSGRGRQNRAKERSVGAPKDHCLARRRSDGYRSTGCGVAYARPLTVAIEMRALSAWRDDGEAR